MSISYRISQLWLLLLIFVGMPLALMQLGDIWLQVKGGALFAFTIAWGTTRSPYKLPPRFSEIISALSFVIGVILTGLLVWQRQTNGFEIIALMAVGFIAFVELLRLRTDVPFRAK